MNFSLISGKALFFFRFFKFLYQEAHLYIDFLPRFCYSHYKFSTANRLIFN